MNEEPKENALNDDELEDVTGGRINRKNIKDKKGKKFSAAADYRAAAEAEADVKGFAEATSRIW